jgi:hypothetical protein
MHVDERWSVTSPLSRVAPAGRRVPRESRDRS